jgi:hypothetical protein
MLVGAENMLYPGRDVHRVTFAQLDRLPVDGENAVPFYDHVDLVVLVRSLPIGLRSDQDIDADLEPWRRMDDLIASVFGDEPGSSPPPRQRGTPQSEACLRYLLQAVWLPARLFS